MQCSTKASQGRGSLCRTKEQSVSKYFATSFFKGVLSLPASNETEKSYQRAMREEILNCMALKQTEHQKGLKLLRSYTAAVPDLKKTVHVGQWKTVLHSKADFK